MAGEPGGPLPHAGSTAARAADDAAARLSSVNQTSFPRPPPSHFLRPLPAPFQGPSKVPLSPKRVTFAPLSFLRPKPTSALPAPLALYGLPSAPVGTASQPFPSTPRPNGPPEHQHPVGAGLRTSPRIDVGPSLAAAPLPRAAVQRVTHQPPPKRTAQQADLPAPEQGPPLKVPRQDDGFAAPAGTPAAQPEVSPEPGASEVRQHRVDDSGALEGAMPALVGTSSALLPRHRLVNANTDALA